MKVNTVYHGDTIWNTWVTTPHLMLNVNLSFSSEPTLSDIVCALNKTYDNYIFKIEDGEIVMSRFTSVDDVVALNVNCYESRILHLN